MLELLRQRLPNERAAELLVAVGEQSKITTIRLDKLLQEHAAVGA
jgi:2-oxo-4-hydroxy-4-carboxy--5-ureidoimidazoline (OHCU) decarboxylase